MEIEFKKDIRKYKQQVYMGFGWRECFFTVLGLVCAVAVYFLLKGKVADKVQGLACMLIMVPFIALGFFEYHGMRIEQFVPIVINNVLRSPKHLKFVAENTWSRLTEEKRKEIISLNRTDSEKGEENEFEADIKTGAC